LLGSIFREDIEQIITSPEIPWGAVKNSAILITGATGLIGRALVHTLSAANNNYGLGLRIIAHGRNASKGAALSQACDAEFIAGDIREPLPLAAEKIDYIFHGAGITNSNDMVTRPTDVITTAIEGTERVLELAAEAHSKSVVYLSSMEVYGRTPEIEVSETDLGYIDLSSPRGSYPESKRMCENMCACWLKQYNVPVKTARLAQTFGAGTPKDDPRVFAQFARSVMAKENIVLHTEGKSRGNYCYISDALRGLLVLLLKGKNGEAYNVVNPAASMTIYEMAKLLADKHGVSVVVDIPDDAASCGYASDTAMHLSSGKINNLGWQPRYSLAEMYERLIADWSENTDGRT